MGGGASLPTYTAHQTRQWKAGDRAIVDLMMPVYYSRSEVTQQDIDTASAVWNLILNDESPEFLKKKADENVPFESCIMWFYDTFYNRLFDVHPVINIISIPISIIYF